MHAACIYLSEQACLAHGRDLADNDAVSIW
jgi:hypothetical protein